MSKQTINIGQTPNDRTGDPLRSAFTKINANFTELYDRDINTDAQTLTLTGDTLAISGGNTVDLSKYVDSTFSGSYNDLTDTPAIPADVSDLTDQGGLLDPIAVSSISNGTTRINIPAENGNIEIDGNVELYGGLDIHSAGAPLGRNDIVFFNSGAESGRITTQGETGNAIQIQAEVFFEVKVSQNDGQGGVETALWEFGADGSLTLPTGVTNNGRIINNNGISLKVDSSFWTFGTDGGLTFPSNSGRINSQVSDGSGLQIEADTDFEIKVVSGGDTTIWSFEPNDNGRIQFPDGSTQTTAYPGPQNTLDGDSISIGRVDAGEVDIYGDVEFNNGVTAFQPGNSVSFNGPVNFASATVTGLQSIVQSQIVGVNNFSTTISQDQWYTKFAKVDIVGDAFGGTSTDTYEIRLGNNRLQFENVIVGTDAYVQNSTPSGSLYINAGAGTVVTGGMGGDLYLSGGERTFGSAIGGNVFVNSNGGDIFIGQLANTAEIRIGGGPDYAGQNPTTFYGNVTLASGKSLTFGDATTQTTAYLGPQTTLNGDVTGSVFSDDSTLLVDGVAGKIVGDVETARLRTSETAIALGGGAGEITQGVRAVAIGEEAGRTDQGVRAVAIGYYAGQTNQSPTAVAIGDEAGQTDQGIRAVAIGYLAGGTNQGNGAVAIGDEAGRTNQAANSIVINAAGGTLNNTTPDSFVVKPIRAAAGTTILMYNATSGEVTHSSGVQETFQPKVDATGVVDHDCSLGHIFYHTSPDANWTANFTNLDLGTSASTNLVLVIEQGATPYYPSAVQISGAAQTIKWLGNVTPTPSANKTEIATFTIFNNAGTFTVLGSYSTYG